MSGRAIDLNADLGEDPAALAAGLDAALLDHVTSANVACGGHAGDEATMREVVRLAKERRVAVGAHPSYPDRARFGRVEMTLPPAEIEESVAAQIDALAKVARSLGVALVHVKPHGALYHAAMRRPDVAEAIARATLRFGRDLVLVGQAGAPALEVWRSLGFRAAPEAFADRRYEADGSLRSRAREGALLTDPEEAARQAVRIAEGRGVVSSDGSLIPILAGTICVHGDTPGAAAVVRAVRSALESSGFEVRTVA